MVTASTRRLTPEELDEKANALVDEGAGDFQAALEAERELDIRRKAAMACETVLHALVVLTDSVLQEKNQLLPHSHGERAIALNRIGRSDLATVYETALASLHYNCYYKQVVGKWQEETMDKVISAIRRELAGRR